MKPGTVTCDSFKLDKSDFILCPPKLPLVYWSKQQTTSSLALVMRLVDVFAFLFVKLSQVKRVTFSGLINFTCSFLAPTGALETLY